MFCVLFNSVNGKRVLGRDFHELVRALQKLGRPVEFGLAPSIDVHVTVDRPPLELELRRVSGRVTVTGFCEVCRCRVEEGRGSVVFILFSLARVCLEGFHDEPTGKELWFTSR